MVSSIQAPPPIRDDGQSMDCLAVAWQNPVTGGAIVPIGLLERTERGYAFTYLRRAMTLPGFRPLLGLDDFGRRYESPGLFPVFRQRLMDSRRPDYLRYLKILGLSRGVEPLEEMGRSEGRRAGDSLFMIPEPLVGDDGHTFTDFFVHGPRHMAGAQERIAMLQLGEPLQLRDEPSNPVNQRALLVTHDGDALGYVPDLLLDYVHTVRAHSDLVITVAQVNGVDAPPNLRLRVHLEGFAHQGYRPFRGSGWDLAAYG